MCHSCSRSGGCNCGCCFAHPATSYIYRQLLFLYIYIYGAFSTATALCLLLLLKSSARLACRPGVAATAAGQHRCWAPLQLLTSARHGCCHQKQGTHCLLLFSPWAALLSCCCCQHRCRLRTAPPPAADSLFRLDCLLQRTDLALLLGLPGLLPCCCC